MAHPLPASAHPGREVEAAAEMVENSVVYAIATDGNCNCISRVAC